MQRIDELLEAGLNLAGIAMVLELQDENRRLTWPDEPKTSGRSG